MKGAAIKSYVRVGIVLVCIITGLILFATPGQAAEMKRIVVIETMPVPASTAHLKWFITQLEEMGYQDGQNMELTVIRANGDRQVAEAGLRKAFQRGKPDAVATIATLAS